MNQSLDQSCYYPFLTAIVYYHQWIDQPLSLPFHTWDLDGLGPGCLLIWFLSHSIRSQYLSISPWRNGLVTTGHILGRHMRSHMDQTEGEFASKELHFGKRIGEHRPYMVIWCHMSAKICLAQLHALAQNVSQRDRAKNAFGSDYSALVDWLQDIVWICLTGIGTVR